MMITVTVVIEVMKHVIMNVCADIFVKMLDIDEAFTRKT